MRIETERLLITDFTLDMAEGWKTAISLLMQLPF